MIDWRENWVIVRVCSQCPIEYQGHNAASVGELLQIQLCVCAQAVSGHFASPVNLWFIIKCLEYIFCNLSVRHFFSPQCLNQKREIDQWSITRFWVLQVKMCFWWWKWFLYVSVVCEVLWGEVGDSWICRATSHSCWYGPEFLMYTQTHAYVCTHARPLLALNYCKTLHSGHLCLSQTTASNTVKNHNCLQKNPVVIKHKFACFYSDFYWILVRVTLCYQASQVTHMYDDPCSFCYHTAVSWQNSN